MSDNRLREISDFAKERGYQFLYGRETFGAVNMGVVVLVSLDRQLDDGDEDATGSAYHALWNELERRTVECDPKTAESRERYRLEVMKIFHDAGVSAFYLEEIPNGYTTAPWALAVPWFRVTTSVGHFEIGHRKRVWEIKWPARCGDGAGLFDAENVTKGCNYIHAWTNEKASEYIRKLVEAA